MSTLKSHLSVVDSISWTLATLHVDIVSETEQRYNKLKVLITVQLQSIYRYLVND